LIDTGTGKRYVRRNKLGTSFVESDDVGRSLATDRRKRAKTKVKSGEGDKGDRPRHKRKAASKDGRKQLLGKAPVGSLPRKGRSAARSLPTSFQIATYLVGYLPNGPIWVHVIKDESNSHLNEARNQTEVSSRRGQIRRTVIKSAQVVFNER
jgi:hypothetical protein